MLLPFVLLLAAGPGDPTPALAPGFAAAAVIAGDEILVGQARATTSPPARVGAIHVFRRAGIGWSAAGNFAAADTKLGDGFGAALAVHGNFLAVGAPRGADGNGAVYLFVRGDDGRWAETLRLVLPDGAPNDLFGATLALQGDLLVVGAPGRDSSRGAAFAFRRGGGGWGGAGLVGRGADIGDRFGGALGIAGDRIVVGAPGPLGGPGQGPGSTTRAGRVTVFRPAAADWAEEARLTPADSVRAFGHAIAVDGNGIFVSAPLAEASAGAVYAFARQGDTWTPSGKLTARSGRGGMRFGMAVASGHGNLFVASLGSRLQSGGIHVFAAGAGGWTEAPLLPSGDPFGDGFGTGLSIGPDLVLATAPGADFGEGKVHAFRKGGGRWAPAGVLIDEPVAMTAVTGTEVTCAASGEAAGFDCRNVDLLAFLPNRAIGGRRGVRLNDIWGWTDPETGREYALVGRMDGTSFVDITDPSNPVYLGDLPLHQGARPAVWRDIKVYRDHAFIVADGAGPHGMQVFDLRQLPRVVGGPITFQETAHYDRIASAHNIVIDEDAGFAYTVGNSAGGETCGGALHMIDITTPSTPTFAGCYADPSTGFARTGYTHDAQCVTYRGPDTRYSGRQICFNASENALGIADVTDKRNPQTISSAAYPNVSYAHQGWLTDDHRYFLLDDEGDEVSGRADRTRTLVWDLARLDEPVLAREFFGTTAASDHNLYIKGRYAFQSNYVAGLRVLDVADPTNPVGVGYFDTVTGDNAPGFDGSWSNYPYFKSGTIIVTSGREGLFLVRHRPQQPVP